MLKKKYEKLDHEGLAGGKFSQFLSEYSNQFDQYLKKFTVIKTCSTRYRSLMKSIFQNHDTWGSYDGDNLITQALKKQLQWSKIQMKHVAKVGATIRDTLPKSQDRIETLLNDTKQAKGLLLNAQIGNQLMGAVGSNLQTLNIQMNEYLQAYSARAL